MGMSRLPVPRATVRTSSRRAVTLAWSRFSLNFFRRAIWPTARLGSIGKTFGSGSTSTVNLLTPTMTRSSSSMDFAYWYALSPISSIWYPDSMAATAPPMSSIFWMYSHARRSTSSVSCSTKYEPASGSGVSATPLSYPMICWVRSAMRAASSVGRPSASSKPFV